MAKFYQAILFYGFQIVSIIDIYPDLTGLSLVLEYMPETLYSKLRNEIEPLNRSQIRKFALMMFKGIDYLHSMGIMHRVRSVSYFTYIFV